MKATDAAPGVAGAGNNGVSAGPGSGFVAAGTCGRASSARSSTIGTRDAAWRRERRSTLAAAPGRFDRRGRIMVACCRSRQLVDRAGPTPGEFIRKGWEALGVRVLQ